MLAPFLALLILGSQPSVLPTVTFQLTSATLPSDTSVFIAGSVDALGNWDAGKVKMEPLGDHRWRKQIQTEEGASIEYKYTLGSWEREPAGPNGLPLRNLVVQVNGNTVKHDDVMNWTKPSPKTPIESTVTGTLQIYRGMKGEGVLDRDVEVWLPPNYEDRGKTRYPVLYMQDGQNVFDAATSSFGVEWQADETADRMIRSHEIPPLIIVGINNTADRTAEYSPGTKGTAYMKFVIHRLKPFIDKTYRTKTDPKNTFVAGSSMGGLISMMLPWEHPEVFSAGICMSPAFLDPNHGKWDYTAQVLTKRKAPRVFFYIDDGGIGLDQKLQPGIDKMIGALEERGFHEGLDFQFVKAPDARHSEADWAKRLPGALSWLLNRKS